MSPLLIGRSCRDAPDQSLFVSVRSASERRKTLGSIEEAQIRVGLESDLAHDGGVLPPVRAALERRALQRIPEPPDLIERGVRVVHQRRGSPGGTRSWSSHNSECSQPISSRRVPNRTRRLSGFQGLLFDASDYSLHNLPFKSPFSGGRMAKRGRPAGTATGSKIVNYAENLGHFLGGVRAKVTSWNSERQQLVKHLSALVSDAQALLTELGHQAGRAGRTGRRAASALVEATVQRRGPGRPKGSKNKPRRKRRKLSAEARGRIAAAQRRRWAKVKAAQKKLKAAEN
jgi:hypothetical protein